MMAMASSGQEDAASRTSTSRPGGIVPSPILWALPKASSWNSSDATATQRACPWQRSRSTCTLSSPGSATRYSFKLMVIVPLQFRLNTVKSFGRFGPNLGAGRRTRKIGWPCYQGTLRYDRNENAQHPPAVEALVEAGAHRAVQ